MLKRILFYWITLHCFITIIKAGPVAANNPRSTRIIREVYPEIEPENDGSQTQVCIVGDVVYGIDEPVPAEQPCLKCKCQPPGVQCETIKCTKKPGCKAIHRPNKCCPDYQCECEHEGKIYANGERLKTLPGGECKVCYCRGGEVQCAQVSCYVRSDCQAKTVPGQCCPKYDNCPPIEALIDRSTTTTTTTLPDINRQILELWPLTRILENSSSIPTSTVYVNQEINKIQDDTPKITIQEIIPAIKEIPITSSPKSDESIIENVSDKFNDDNSNNVVTDSDTDSSEVSEIFQQPPPVLRIGDKLLFLKQGELVPEKGASTPSSVITIIGAEGLQPGYEESSEILHDEHEQKQYNGNLNDLETKASETTHILSLVKRKTTTEPPSSTASRITTESQPTTTESIDDNTTEITTITSEVEDITTEFIENSTNFENITETFETTVLPNITTGTILEISRNSSKDLKINPDVLVLRHNSSIPTNLTNSEWLKNYTLLNPRAVLPDEILKTIVPSDIEAATITDLPENLTTVETERSIESVDNIEDDSRELTTPKNYYKTTIQTSNDSASIETFDEITETTNLEITDMLNGTNQSKNDDDVVEIIDDETKPLNNIETTINPMKKDVEIIDNLKNLTDFNIDEKVVELKPKIIEKRENNENDQSDEIFKQLNDELNDNNDDDGGDEGENNDRQESERIFKELLEETSTPKTKKIPQNKDEETLQRISDAIASITFGNNNNNNHQQQRNLFNNDILGLISSFFGAQSKNRN